MKKFIVASLIFALLAFGGVVCDAFIQVYMDVQTPIFIYYMFGWIAAGCYVAISQIMDRKGK